jgi:hypothetical protein
MPSRRAPVSASATAAAARPSLGTSICTVCAPIRNTGLPASAQAARAPARARPAPAGIANTESSHRIENGTTVPRATASERPKAR